MFNLTYCSSFRLQVLKKPTTRIVLTANRRKYRRERPYVMHFFVQYGQTYTRSLSNYYKYMFGTVNHFHLNLSMLFLCWTIPTLIFIRKYNRFKIYYEYIVIIVAYSFNFVIHPNTCMIHEKCTGHENHVLFFYKTFVWNLYIYYLSKISAN